MQDGIQNARVTSWDFIHQNYGPDDRLAIVILNRKENFTYQRIADAATAASPRFQRFLRYENASGADIYISMNTLKPDAHTRTKADIAAIRHFYLDLDHDGAERLNQILADPNLPTPNYVLDTSPGKHQVIWRVADAAAGPEQAFTIESAEAALRGLARQYGGDPAATDATRVLRLPGFHNKKYGDPVRVDGHRVSEATYTPMEFDRALACARAPGRQPPLPIGTQASTVGAPERPAGRRISQSERDWAWVREQLKTGADPDALRRELAELRQDKGNSKYYAERTVSRARSR